MADPSIPMMIEHSPERVYFDSPVKIHSESDHSPSHDSLGDEDVFEGPGYVR